METVQFIAVKLRPPSLSGSACNGQSSGSTTACRCRIGTDNKARPQPLSENNTQIS